MYKLLVVGLLLAAPLPARAQSAEQVQLSVHVKGPEFNGILNTHERRKDLENKIALGVHELLQDKAHRPLVIGKDKNKPAIVVSIVETEIQIELRKSNEDPELDPIRLPLYPRGHLERESVRPPEIAAKVHDTLWALRGDNVKTLVEGVSKVAPLLTGKGLLQLLDKRRGVLRLTWLAFCALGNSEFRLIGDDGPWEAAGTGVPARWSVPGKSFDAIKVHFKNEAPRSPDAVIRVAIQKYVQAEGDQCPPDPGVTP